MSERKTKRKFADNFVAPHEIVGENFSEGQAIYEYGIVSDC